MVKFSWYERVVYVNPALVCYLGEYKHDGPVSATAIYYGNSWTVVEGTPDEVVQKLMSNGS